MGVNPYLVEEPSYWIAPVKRSVSNDILCNVLKRDEDGTTKFNPGYSP